MMSYNIRLGLDMEVTLKTNVDGEPYIEIDQDIETIIEGIKHTLTFSVLPELLSHEMEQFSLFPENEEVH